MALGRLGGNCERTTAIPETRAMLDLSRVEAHHKVTFSNPLVARCPGCGEMIPRHETRRRWFWEANLHVPTVRIVHMGCYICPTCPRGSAWFVQLPPDCQTGSQYTRTTVRLLVDLLVVRKMPAEIAAAFAREELHLPKLDAGTLLDWFRARGTEAQATPHLANALAVFSGQIALDELYERGRCHLVATDPVSDCQLDAVLLDHPATEDDVRAFCRRLAAAGFSPQLVVTDGSKLYPPVLAAVWPAAQHQRCVFHFIQQVNTELRDAFWAAYRTLPAPPKRKRGRPPKRGRPRLDGQKRQNQQAVREARYLVLTREAGLREKQRARLAEALAVCPALDVIRRFVLALHELFGPTTTTATLAEERRRAILDDVAFKAAKGLDKVLAYLADDDLFARLTRYLDFDHAEKTSNHVERENREYRKRQKSCYRLRSLASIQALSSLLRARRQVVRPHPALVRRPTPVHAKEVLAAH